MFRYKPAPPATTPVKLPKTRWQMFWDIVKNNFSLIVNLSLLCSLFALPLIVVYTLMYTLTTSALGGENAIAKIFSTVFYLSIVAIPCYSVWFLGLNGAFAVMKRRVWNQGCVIRSTFWTSIKSGKSALLGAIVGLVIALATVGSMYLLIYGADAIQQGLGIGICMILVVLFATTAMYFLSGNNLYDLPFSALFRNSFAFSWMALLRNLALNLVFLALPVFLIVLHPISAFITLFVIVMLLQGTAVCSWTLVSHSLFDKHINSQYYPEYVNKGLDTQNNSQGEQSNG